MKKLLLLLFILSSSAFAEEVQMNFKKDIFVSAQKSGKTVVINSWNKWCFTCVKQEKIIKQAKEDFKDILFLSYAQKNKEIARAIGITKKEDIYSLIKKGI